MVEVHPNIYVGDEDDYYNSVKGEENWAVVHACKEPFHRQALGYTGRAAPKTHPEYLVAKRENRLILNIVDASDPAFFAVEMINETLDFVGEALSKGKKVLIHCNLGESRSPSLALLYLASRLNVLSQESFDVAEQNFVKTYPRYNPRRGIREHLKQNWEDYCRK